MINKKQKHQNFIEIFHTDTSIGSSSKVLARVVVRKSWEQQQTENARLIAAAPDLFDFVEYWLSRQGTDRNYMTDYARLVLGKAKSQS